MKPIKLVLAPLAASLFLGACGTQILAENYSVPTQQQVTGAQAIEDGDYTRAEQMLRADLVANPQDPHLMLNLAYVLTKTGRDAEARQLYAKVMQSNTSEMAVLQSGKASRVQSVARVALEKMDQDQ